MDPSYVAPDGGAEEGALLRIYLLESERWKGRSLYAAIVETARSYGVAGTTVLRGVEGFGRSRHPHTERILQLSFDLPTIVEIVDEVQRIDGLCEVLRPLLEGRFVTAERLTLISHPRRSSGAGQDT